MPSCSTRAICLLCQELGSRNFSLRWWLLWRLTRQRMWEIIDNQWQSWRSCKSINWFKQKADAAWWTNDTLSNFAMNALSTPERVSFNSKICCFQTHFQPEAGKRIVPHDPYDLKRLQNFTSACGRSKHQCAIPTPPIRLRWSILRLKAHASAELVRTTENITSLSSLSQFQLFPSQNSRQLLSMGANKRPQLRQTNKTHQFPI